MASLNEHPKTGNKVRPNDLLTTMMGLLLMFFSSYSLQAAPQASSPQYNAGPVTNYSTAQPDTGDVLRFRRGERFNIPDPSVAELGEDSDAHLMQLPASHFRRESMPFGSSDAVVVGSIKAGQAYLSNDKREIYSEFKVQLSEILKSPSTPYLTVGSLVDVSRRGGAIKLPSGKVLLRGSEADSMPQIAARYLMFLKYNADAEDYTLITGFRLETDRVYYLDDQDEKSSDHPRFQHALRPVGQDENQFLLRARRTATQKKGGE
jgi:hypothetical protein